MSNDFLTKYKEAKKKLLLFSQQNLLSDYDSLNQNQQLKLLEDINDLSPNFFLKAQELLGCKTTPCPEYTVCQDFQYSGSKIKFDIGLQALKEGTCGCILIAGGQGTRLNHSGPKGTFPISALKQKSLFQIFSEKLKALQHLGGIKIPLAIMTSLVNDKATKDFFLENDYFGLEKGQIFFFSQPSLPFLNEEHQFFLQSQSEIAKGPDGNGSIFQAFKDSGLQNQWENFGIEYLNIILVDNPLACPIDCELMGELIESRSDISQKCCLRKSVDEKVGIIALKDNKPVIVEYHELPESIKTSKNAIANLSLFSLTMRFAKKMSKIDLPLHFIQKKYPYYDFKSKQIISPIKPNAYKFEKYIFDVLPHAKKTSILVYPREQIFAPLKNLEGDNGVSFVQKALINRDKKIYEAISGLSYKHETIELPQNFHYPTDVLKKEYYKKEIDSSFLS